MRKKSKYLFILLLALLLVFVPTYLQAQNPSSRINLSQASSLYQKGEYQKAIFFWEQALDALAAQESAQELAPLYTNLATAYSAIGQTRKAVDYWEKAIQIYREQPSRNSELAKALVDLAQDYNLLGLPLSAQPLVEEALTLSQDPLIEAVGQRVLGTTYLIAGNFDQAIAAYQASLNHTTTLAATNLRATALNHLFEAYQRREQKSILEAQAAQEARDPAETEWFEEQARQDHQKAQATAQEAVQISPKNSLAQARALVNLAILTQQPQYSRRALALLNQLPPSRTQAYLLIALAPVSQQTVSLLERSTAITTELGDPRTAAFALTALGKYYEDEQAYDQALKTTNQALILAQAAVAPDSFYPAAWQAGRIYQAMGREPEALDAYRQAVGNLQSLRSDLVATNENLRLDFRTEIEPIYRELLKLLLTQPNQAQLTEAVETSELLQLAQLQNFFGDDCVSITLNNNPQEVVNETNTGIIRSIILEDKTYVLLQLPNRPLASYLVPMSSSQLQELLLDWRMELESPRNPKGYLNASQQLYDLLIRPLESKLKQVNPDVLIFINDGLIGNMPMAALHDGRQFLIEKFPIINSLGLELNLASEVPERGDSLIYGLTVPVGSFRALPYVRSETKNVQELLGGKRYLNDEFTKDGLRQQLKKAKNLRVLHLATHGKFGSTSENSFVQAFEQKISLQELESLLNQTDAGIALLVLSACETAIGSERAFLGLAGVGLRANVETTLGSLWAVQDEAVAMLVTDFYQLLRQPGMTKAEALRQAQITQIERSRSHPSFWSPFVLMGGWL